MRKPTGALTMAYRKNNGFTLIELMVTLAIATVVLGIGVPSMANLIRDARISSQSDLLVSTLNRARTEALRQRRDFRVCPATTPASATAWEANLQTWATGWITVGNSAVSQRIEAKPGVTVTAAFDDVTFRGTLGSATQTRTFTLCVSGRKEQLVEVNLSGNVSKRIGTTVCA